MMYKMKTRTKYLINVLDGIYMEFSVDVASQVYSVNSCFQDKNFCSVSTWLNNYEIIDIKETEYTVKVAVRDYKKCL